MRRFAEWPRSAYRVDATAWAILALREDIFADAVTRARTRLAQSQLKDGRVPMSDDHPGAFWPTALSILAWHTSPYHLQNQNNAVQFLLGTEGLHFKKKSGQSSAHDPDLVGWPWTENTFSWIEPTAWAVLALKLCGHSRHSRVQDATRLLMDRQLPGGGWNYGNTIVYDQVLLPQPDTTGIALAALSGLTERKTVEKSLVYLRDEIGFCRTPLSLGWAGIGLSAWQERPPQTGAWITETVDHQKTSGAYGTTLLSLLKCASLVKGDIVEFIASRNS